MSIGQPLPRFEDRRLIVGRGCYTSDLAFPGHAACHFLRSEYAHADIAGIETDAARACDGVLAILTSDDYQFDGCHPIPHAVMPPDALDPARPGFGDGDGAFILDTHQPPLAAERVRYVGEIVAMVVAESAAQARDAAEHIVVEYAERELVIDADAAMKPGAPQLWAQGDGNLGLKVTFGDATKCDAAFSAAALVVERDFYNQRVVACQMEPRSAVGTFDTETGLHTIYAGSQGVVRWRVSLAQALGIPLDRMRVVCPDVGGGFGPRTSLSPEAVLVAWAARKLDRTVRWVGDRTESFLADYQGRDVHTRIAVGFDAEGKILGMRERQRGNLGAYSVSYAPFVNGYRVVGTVYDVPVATVDVEGVFTNTVPTVPYRGAGRPEATFAIERVLDIAAGGLNIGRDVIRWRNLISKDKLPCVSAMGLVIDSGDFRGNMDRALSLSDWYGFPERRREARAGGRLRGIGISNYMESPVGAPRERLELTVSGRGAVEIVAGTQSTGQGHETTYAQVVAHVLGVDPETILLVTGDTNRVSVGGGTHSDRSMRLAGTLLTQACDEIVAKASKALADRLGCAASRVSYEHGVFSAPGINQPHDIFSIAALVPGAQLSATAEISKRLPAYPTGCAVCELEVDPGTGSVTIERYCSVDDVGQPINPQIVDGQVHGGIAQGVGQALFEVFGVDPASGQVTSASFMDYCVPRADTLPDFAVELAEDPTALNPLRIKGGGEGGITPATSAVINALVDALSPYGIDHIEMPATPSRVWGAIQAATERAGHQATGSQEKA